MAPVDLDAEGGGGEPDYRFTLANERTFLAWIRTALALLAGGIAVRSVDEPFDVSGAATALALAAVVLSAGSVLLAYRRWVRVEAAIRAGRPLPTATAVPLVAAGMALLAVAAGVLLVLG